MEGIVKIKGEKNLFYDSIDRVYRYRMHCPECGRPSGCRCFITIEKAYTFIEDCSDFICSSKCYLDYLFVEDDPCYVEETMKDMGIIFRIKWYIYKYFNIISEVDAFRVVGNMDIDYDSVTGEYC